MIGVSGGLDSTQALIVAARTMDRLGLPRTNILAYTMPGFATSDTHARQRPRPDAGAGGHRRKEIDIRPSCMQMLRDIGPSVRRGEPVYDVTFENVQAGERTSHLFRLANFHDGLVLGTGDLSELALGWATYGVGDHMSHYNVNASVPKTLIQHLIRWVIDLAAVRRRDQRDAAVDPGHRDLARAGAADRGRSGTRGAKPAQSTQEKIGPYELQDFNLYYITRFGFRPSKVAFLSQYAWSDAARGSGRTWVSTESQHREYDLATIKTLAGGLPLPLLQDQPVQALGGAERAEGRLRRLAFAARRLARAERFRGGRVAGGAATERAEPRIGHE